MQQFQTRWCLPSIPLSDMTGARTSESLPGVKQFTTHHDDRLPCGCPRGWTLISYLPTSSYHLCSRGTIGNSCSGLVSLLNKRVHREFESKQRALPKSTCSTDNSIHNIMLMCREHVTTQNYDQGSCIVLVLRLEIPNWIFVCLLAVSKATIRLKLCPFVSIMRADNTADTHKTEPSSLSPHKCSAEF